LNGVQKTLGIVEKKTILPILNNVLIMTKGGKVRIVATDREISLIADYDANVILEGDITLSARKLYEMIREIQGDMIYLKKDEHNIVTITCGKGVNILYKILGVPADDFPNIGDDINTELFRIKGSALIELIHKTFPAMSTDEMKRDLSGVFLKIEKTCNMSVAKMVATDGFRLTVSCVEIPEVEFCGLDKGIIIPRKGVVEIRRLIENSDIDITGDVMMGVQGGMCVIKTNSAILKVSLVDVGYPDYQRVIPADIGDVVCFNKDTMLRALRRMNVVSSEGCDGVIIKLVNDMMVLSSNNPDVGEAKEEVEVLYKGEEIEVGYNINFLIDAMEVIDEEKITFDVGVGVRPGIIKALDNDNYICAVMPMRF
jgi:DNA polymerase-3 subunit beta